MSFSMKVASAATLMIFSVAGLLSSEASFAGDIGRIEMGSLSLSTVPSTRNSGADTSGRPVDAIVVTVPDSADPASQAQEAADPQFHTLAALVASQDADIDPDEEMRCLAGAVYFEAKGESLAGQLAVARVVINRAHSGRFPASLCGVVYQAGQFSFVRGNSMPRINMTSASWKRAVAIADIALDDSWDSPAEGALFFHARHVSPRWNLHRIATIENHIFYR